VLFAIDDFDEQTLDWATRRNPLFGNIEDAKDASDRLDDLSKLNFVVTGLLVPTRPGIAGLGDRAAGLALGAAAVAITESTTNGLKDVTERQRPDRDKRDSFPSLHASRSAVTAPLAARNLEHYDLVDWQRRTLQGVSYGVAGLTGWARVEGQRHYPSDVLVGYALGHFIGAFINDAFIAPEQQQTLGVTALAGPGEVEVGFHYRW
jgi:hypothetical protein